jgi:hypothetical protein
LNSDLVSFESSDLMSQLEFLTRSIKFFFCFFIELDLNVDGSEIIKERKHLLIYLKIDLERVVNWQFQEFQTADNIQNDNARSNRKHMH